jgi:hypothetical protein
MGSWPDYEHEDAGKSSKIMILNGLQELILVIETTK